MKLTYLKCVTAVFRSLTEFVVVTTTSFGWLLCARRTLCPINSHFSVGLNSLHAALGNHTSAFRLYRFPSSKHPVVGESNHLWCLGNWLLSLRVMFSRFVHGWQITALHPFSLPSNIPLRVFHFLRHYETVFQSDHPPCLPTSILCGSRFSAPSPTLCCLSFWFKPSSWVWRGSS